MLSHINLTHIIILLQLAALQNRIVFDRVTEPTITTKRAQLQKEAAELTSFVHQNQDITHTLMNVCQR